jgi:putative flippase GtrA
MINKIKLLTENHLVHRKDDVLIEFVRYIFAGGIAFIVDFSSLYVLTDICGIYYLISAAIAFLLGTTVKYLLSISWVFSKRRLETKHLEFSIFAIIGIVGLALNEIIIWYFTEYIHFHYLLSKIISACSDFLWNFSARKVLLFR